MLHRLDIRGLHKDIYSGHLKMSGLSPQGDRVDFTNYYMTYNGWPYFVISGEFHFSRYDCRMWEEELLKMKACGVNIVATYMFWNHHESTEGVFDFSFDNDIRRFITLCQKHGLMVILRIGPYSHGECRNGGLPDWLFGRPFELRSNDSGYLKYVERYFAAIGEQVSDLMLEKGGNVIGVQLENEYMSACSPWEVTVAQNREWTTSGRDGVEHMKKLKELAERAGIKPAFYTCTAWDNAPYIDNEMLPLWGGYAYWPWIFWNPDAKEHPPTYGYLFSNRHDERNNSDFDKKYPYACCEIGGGMQTWYPYRFIVEPESVEAMALVTIAGGCNFIGYYMFHGGRNPIINNTYTNEQLTPRISYDFQAPLSDFGQARESYRRLRLLHYFIQSCNDELCRTIPAIPEGQDKINPTDTEKLRYAVRAKGGSGFIFINNYQDHVEQTIKEDVRFEIMTENGLLRIPGGERGLTIDKNLACVLPFNMELSGIKLMYSTAQYITRIGDAHFFFCHWGMQGEFCFGEEYDIMDSHSVQYEKKDGMLVLSKMEGWRAWFTLISFKGEAVKFVCLDREESLDFCKLNISGVEYAILCRAGSVYADGNDIFIEVQGDKENEGIALLSYPKLEFAGTKNGEISYKGTEGFMHCYDVCADFPRLNYEISKEYSNRAEVRFDANILDSLTELYLKVDYFGDIGWAFINGRLIHDNFYNGDSWYIGLKSFAEELKRNNLYLYISPITNEGMIIKYESTHEKIEGPPAGTAYFTSVKMLPEQTVVLRCM